MKIAECQVLQLPICFVSQYFDSYRSTRVIPNFVNLSMKEAVQANNFVKVADSYLL